MDQEPKRWANKETIYLEGAADMPTRQAPPEYKEIVFLEWYKAGKPGANRLYTIIPEDESKKGKIGVKALAVWIKEDFWPRAKVLDEQVMEQIEARMIQDKVAMLKRHADVSEEMQTMAIEYLRAHKADLTIPAAVRMLVSGIEIERQSRGMGNVLEELTKKSDADLLQDIQKMIERSPVEITPVEIEDGNAKNG